MHGREVKPSLRSRSVVARRWQKWEYLNRALLALFVLGIGLSLMPLHGFLVFAVVLAVCLLPVAGLAWVASRGHQVRLQQLSQDQELTVPAEFLTSGVVWRSKTPRGIGRLAIDRLGMEWRPMPRAARKGVQPIRIAWEQVRNFQLTPASRGLAHGARLDLTLSSRPDMVMIVGDYPVFELAANRWWREVSEPGPDPHRP